MENKFFEEIDNGYLSAIHELHQVADKVESLNLQGTWQFLENSEALLIELINNNYPDSNAEAGNIEFGGVLYVVDKVLDDSLNPILILARDILRLLGLPESKMTADDISKFESEALFGPGIVAGDGTLYSDIHFGQLDPRWILAVVKYVHYLIFPDKKANFGIKPLCPDNQCENKVFETIANQESLTIAVFGDWGTGPWNDGGGLFHDLPSPSQLVAAGINQLAPDISFHLGDVYYAGLPHEEKHALLHGFPQGKFLNFTLNSNHEAYDGSNGYFNVALNDQTDQLFAIQKNTSYFAFTFGDWLLIGLDSAYFDKSFMVMQGAIDQSQIEFIQGLTIKDDQKVLLFTHHTALTTNGKEINNSKNENNLYNQVQRAFNWNLPGYWYYGHTHNAIVYNDNAPLLKNLDATKSCKFRCVGHAAIPFGNGYELSNKEGIMVDTVDYYAHTPMPNPDPRQTKRVLNGFAILTLTRDSLTEKFYEVQADEGGGVKVIQAYPPIKVT